MIQLRRDGLGHPGFFLPESSSFRGIPVAELTDADRGNLSTMLRLKSSIATPLLIGWIVMGCNTESNSSNFFQSRNQPAHEAAVAAEGWDHIEAEGWPFSLSVDTTGHWETSTNPCTWQPASGALDLETWNKLARLVNEINKLSPLAEEKCFDNKSFVRADPKHRHIVQNIKLHFEDKTKRALAPRLYNDNQEICSLIDNQAKMKELVRWLDLAMTKATYDTCPSLE
jgi:hypothetical protein